MRPTLAVSIDEALDIERVQALNFAFVKAAEAWYAALGEPPSAPELQEALLCNLMAVLLNVPRGYRNEAAKKAMYFILRNVARVNEQPETFATMKPQGAA